MKRFLITSFTTMLGSNRTNLSTYLNLQAKVYFDRLTKYGFDVEIHSERDSFFPPGSTVFQLNLNKYTDVIVLYSRANFYNGGISGAIKRLFESIEAFGQPSPPRIRWWFFYDDMANPPDNLANRFCIRRDSGKYFQHLSDTMYVQSRLLSKSFISNPMLLIPGGNLEYRTNRMDSLPISDQHKVDDEWQNFYVAEELHKLSLGINTEHKSFDVMYAGIARKYRCEVLEGIFGCENLSSVSYMTNDGEIRKNFLPRMKKFKNHTIGENFLLLNSPKKHSESWTNIIVGDKWQKNNFKSLRFYQALKYKSVPLIHIEYDHNREYLEDPLLKRYCYFKDVDDIIEIVASLKSQPLLYKRILELCSEVKPKVEEFKFDIC